MSSILRRTIYADTSNNEIRFFDWNMVVTTLGTMIEPSSLNRFPSGQEYDPADELYRIDALESVDILREMYTKCGSGEVIHGGGQGPRQYDYNP